MWLEDATHECFAFAKGKMAQGGDNESIEPTSGKEFDTSPTPAI
tara:strand:+ start:508 stop:639 length:132 start_codon:yes stop_codon:yes gene_type:complete